MIDHYEADVQTAQDYYPFGMIMPGRMFTALTVPGGSVSGTTQVNGFTVPVDLALSSRTGNEPTQYVASRSIDLEEGFESGVNDDVTAYIADTSYAGSGNGGSGADGVAGAGKYRYGFNGKEKDNEVKGMGDQIDYGMRVYDPRAGRFLSVDPLSPKYPELSSYQYASNRPIDGIDRDGLEYVPAIPKVPIYGRGVSDYAAAIDNGVIDVLNLVPTLWNSGVSTVQSLSRHTYGSDLRREVGQAASGIKQAAVKAWNEPIKTLTSPEALEFAVSTYIGGKLLPTGGGKGNLLKPTVDNFKLSADLPPGTQTAGFSFARSNITAAVDKVLSSASSTIKGLDEDAIVGYRGSLATGVKFKTGGPFNPGDFDVDAFIVSDKLAKQFKSSLSFRSARQIDKLIDVSDAIEKTFQETFSGYRVEPNKPFTFRVFTQAEFEKIVKPAGYNVVK